MKIVVIGAGAAGLMAAANICAPTLTLERNEKAGKKLYITGKGRCNLTNDLPPDEFLKRVVKGEKFARGMIHRFPPAFVMDFFEKHGLRLKTERGGRVFPLSDKASDVTKTLLAAAVGQGAEIIYDTFVKGVERCGEGYRIIVKDGAVNDERVIDADILIIAAGGKTYPATGSDGSIYGVLRALGHEITPLYPSLVPFVFKEDTAALRGISLKNVGAKVWNTSAEGEILFTDNGVSGPVILTLSALCAGHDNLKLQVDFFPKKTREEIDKRLAALLADARAGALKNTLAKLLPKSLVWYIINGLGIGNRAAADVTKVERAAIAGALKGLEFTLSGTGGFDEAVVTRGGVSLAQVDPKTMESKVCKNLFIIGEILDMDVLTGGFNLQL
ncbi:MAG: aminoacetone oxidase family FAD-binding enzyme, partial [Firmicutes bacterium]|nr:aminoacetone oxidase family FAD-binding enzyme [Bacillota bacterium]